MKIAEFFQEDSGKLSSMRLNCFMAIVTAIILSFNSGSYEFVLTFLVAGFAPKAFAKFSEAKVSK